MKIRKRVVVTPIAVLMLGCAAGRPLAPKVGKIAVAEFQVGETVTAVSAYSEPIDGVGRTLAQRVVEVLRARDRDAFVVGKGEAPTADIIVQGRITRIDGGSRAGRLLMSQTLGFGFTDYGAGGGFLRAEGRVVRADGKTVGTFSSEHKEKSTGWFWVRYGDSAKHQVAGCVDDVGAEIAEMIDEGQYRGVPEVLQTQEPAPPAPSVVTRTPADR